MRALDEAKTELNTPSYDATSVFFHLQTALLHSAGVSLAFWPINKKARERGRLLRAGFSCQSSIEFLKAREFRNHIAHMDERLDNWWSTSKRHRIVRHTIGDENASNGLDVTEIIERLDPSSATLFFRGDKYDLRDFWWHLSEVHEESKRLAKVPSWHPSFEEAFKLEL